MLWLIIRHHVAPNQQDYPHHRYWIPSGRNHFPLNSWVSAIKKSDQADILVTKPCKID